MKYITVLGWEERFILGLEKSQTLFPISSVELFKYKEYTEATNSNLTRVRKNCVEQGIDLNEYSVSYNDPANIWINIQTWVNTNIYNNEELYLDISTMPRETIWTFLFFILQKSDLINYVYSSPVNYDRDWLCKEPDKPRLLFKHSGITEFDKETVLVLLTGFDADRVGQLVNFFEPKITVLCTQEGDQYDNSTRNNLEEHIRQCAGLTQIETVFLNSYSTDHGLSVLENTISALADKYNVIVSSLGPKLSAVSLYKVYRKHPNIALTYVPTKEYSLKYSEGLKELFHYKF